MLRTSAFLFVCMLMAMPLQADVVNGSLTGPIANANVPVGWTTLQGSPDTMDETNNVGAGVAWGATPSGPSPDGGTWVGIARDVGFTETFGQTVSTLVSGQDYRVSWYQGNFGALVGSPGYVSDNAIVAYIDGAAIGNGGVISLGPDWSSASVDFTATSTSQDLSFGLLNEVRSYLSIDGIRLQAIPEPTGMFAVSLALCGFITRRRNRKA